MRSKFSGGLLAGTVGADRNATRQQGEKKETVMINAHRSVHVVIYEAIPIL